MSDSVYTNSHRLTIDFLYRYDYHCRMKKYDVIIIGAGAAGLTAARHALENGRRTAVFDIGDNPARKVALSGGGRCNFTNAAAAHNRYFGRNQDFVRGAIARICPDDMLQWARERHNLSFVEKSPGQYFCVQGAGAVVDALMADCNDADFYFNASVRDVAKTSDGFLVQAGRIQAQCQSIIIATGGISFPAAGVSDAGYVIAKNFGHKIVPVRPALCAIATKRFSDELAGVSVPVEIRIAGETIRDDMLFTHFGIGGPAAYRATVRDMSGGMEINLAPGMDVAAIMRMAKQNSGRKSAAGVLGAILPARVAKWAAPNAGKNIADYKDCEIDAICDRICRIRLDADEIKLHGMQSAEIVRGGIDTDGVSSKTMESKICPGMFFAGEVLDIAGDLGGFNLHWAWASGAVAGKNA